MSRIRTKGRTIGVQLPLALDAEVRRIATKKGLSPGQWLNWFVVNKLSEINDK